MITTEAVAEIKACEGVYRGSDVARHYGVHRSTVVRVWQGHTHADVEAAEDFPEITAPLRGQDLRETVRTLLQRGLSPSDAATEAGVSRSTVYAIKGLYL